MRHTHLNRLTSLTTAFATWGAITSPAFANPQGPTIVGGSATVTTSGKTETITQSTPNAIINWYSFNIAPGETTNFVQPNASSSILNRVTGGGGSSQIYGTLTANGRVFIVNPDGIVFGKGAQVNVGGLVATTHDIANSDFMSGNYLFSIPGNPTASVVNEGKITAANGGFAALVAPGVRNSGTITANLGTVALGAAGSGFTLDFYGDQLINLKVSGDIAANVQDAATGQVMSDLVSNTGKLKANGGTVQMSATTARKVVDSVVNNTGVIEANSVGTKSGTIILGAQTADTKSAGAPVQTVKVSGKLIASGKKSGTTGGKIQVTGENITLARAKLNASGAAGGGTILVGGDFMGGNPAAPAVTLYGQSLEQTPVPNATTVSVDSASVLNASAVTLGNGGKVVVWSNAATAFAGSILATGGSKGGNGGFVETSGSSLNIGGSSVSTAAPKGQSGHWLLDPSDYTIDQTAALSIESALAHGDVIIATVADGNAGNGDINVNSSISWLANTTLLLDAYHGITVNGSITGANLGVVTNNGGSGGYFTVNAPISLSSGLTINGAQYTLINTAADLQNIGTSNFPLNGNYALASDITLAGNFTPIDGFTGKFEGLGHSITGLSVNSPTSSPAFFVNVGLFATVTGTIENLSIANGSVTLNMAGAAGLLAGTVGGLVYNVSTSGTVTGTEVGTGGLGGLAGYTAGSGTIVSSSANVAVTDNSNYSTGYMNLGGLVGLNIGSISASFATGPVAANYAAVGNYGSNLGGLVGHNAPNNGVGVLNSYATGSVTLTSYDHSNNQSPAGSLIGNNIGVTGASGFATGAVQFVNCASCLTNGLVGLGNPVISTPSTITTLQAQAQATASLVAAAGGSGNSSNSSVSGSGGTNSGGTNTGNSTQTNNGSSGNTSTSNQNGGATVTYVDFSALGLPTSQFTASIFGTSSLSNFNLYNDPQSPYANTLNNADKITGQGKIIDLSNLPTATTGDNLPVSLNEEPISEKNQLYDNKNELILNNIASTVNPQSGVENCAYIADSVIQWLNGNYNYPSAVASDDLDRSWAEIQSDYNIIMNWNSQSFESIFEAMESDGNGTVGIIGIKEDGVDHIVVIANVGGTVAIIEGQTWVGQTTGTYWPPGAIYNVATANSRYQPKNLGFAMLPKNRSSHSSN